MPLLAGLAAGVAGALALSSTLTSLLFDVQPHDPVIVATVVSIVGAVGLLTCGVATRQGLAIDPAAALRDE